MQLTAHSLSRPDPTQLHQALAALAFTRNLADSLIIFVQLLLQPARMAQQVLDASIRPAGQGFQMGADLLAQSLRLLRQYHTEFGQQPPQAVVSSGRSSTNPCRVRCKLRVACWCSSLTGTKRMLGRVTASQMAAASA